MIQVCTRSSRKLCYDVVRNKKFANKNTVVELTLNSMPFSLAIFFASGLAITLPVGADGEGVEETSVVGGGGGVDGVVEGGAGGGEGEGSAVGFSCKTKIKSNELTIQITDSPCDHQCFTANEKRTAAAGAATVSSATKSLKAATSSLFSTITQSSLPMGTSLLPAGTRILAK